MTDSTHHIEIDDLPEDLRQIAEIIGLPAMLALSAHLRGQRLYLPPPERLSIQARNRAIRSEFNGRNFRDLAAKHNLTVRWVRAIVTGENGPEEAAGREALYKQQKLF
jgi:Mor family transcriptional regulator